MRHDHDGSVARDARAVAGWLLVLLALAAIAGVTLLAIWRAGVSL